MYCLSYLDVCVCVCVYVVIYVYYLANMLSMFYSHVFMPSFYDVIYKIFKHYAFVTCARNNSTEGRLQASSPKELFLTNGQCLR